MSKKIKNEQKKFLGETLNQYDKALDEAINQLDKKNREQNHKISSLVNSFDNEFLEKDVEGNMTTLENSKDGMVIINEIQGSTEVNYCKDGEKELILNGDIDTQGESFVTITEGVDGGLVDVSLEGNTEINLSKTKDPVLVTREFDDINCNSGKLQYTIDDVTTINDEPGKVDIDRIVGDTMVNHAVNGSEELILNAHINESGDNNITLNGVTSDGGKVDVALEGNTLVNVSNVKDDYITPTIEDKVDQGSVISLPEVSEGLIHIDSIEGNTLVNYCTDGAKELILNGDIDVEGISVTTTEGVDNGLVDVALEGNTLVNLMYEGVNTGGNSGTHYVNASSATLKDFASRIKTSTTYTIIIYNAPEEVFRVFLGGCMSDLEVKPNVFILTTGENKVTAEHFHFYTSNGEIPSDVLSGIKIAILEGDYTDKEIPPYFEGMKSVGQDDENGHKVEIASKNGNFIELDNMVHGSFTDNGMEHWGADTEIKTEYFIEIPEGCTRIYFDRVIDRNNRIWQYDENKNSLGTSTAIENADTPMDLDSNAKYIRCRFLTGDTSTKIILFFNEKIEPKHGKKEILLNEPLRSLPSEVEDRFVKMGGKWFIERKCGSVIFDGSDDEGWEKCSDTAWETDTHIAFRINIYDMIVNNWSSSSVAILDKFKTIKADGTNYSNSDEFSSTDASYLNIKILKSKLSTQDAIGFKQWLSENPVTAIYELSTPVYEPLEIEPTLNTYNDTTHISNNSIIPCNMKIKNTGYNAIIKPSTLYTVALDTSRKGETEIGINLAGAEVTTTNNVATITTPETLTDDSLRLYGKNIRGLNVRLLEGDKTNCIPSFFEGMKSSFEDKVQEDGSYKMEILSNNKNIFTNKKYFRNDAVLIDTPDDNTVILKDTVPNAYREIFFIIRGLKANVNYIVTSDVNVIAGEPLIALQDINGTDGAFISKTETSNRATFKLKQGHDSIRLRLFANHLVENVTGHIEYRNIQIREESAPETYEVTKSNKIQLSSIEPLRGVGNFHDRIVFKDGKLMIERNCRQENMSELKFAGDTSDTMKCLILFKSKPKAISNIFSNSRGYESATKGQMYVQERGNGMTYLWIPTDPMSREEFTNFLNEKNATIVYVMSEPTYEEIPYNLQKIILESYANGTLFFDTNIPPTKVSFNCFEEELTYLYPATSYTLQFVSDRNTTADISLGGTQLLAQSITRGVNRISITTPDTLVDNKLIIDGAGAKISNVVVTNTDRRFGYFEGMKSVGECEELEVVSNNKNLAEFTYEKGNGCNSIEPIDGGFIATFKGSEHNNVQVILSDNLIKLNSRFNLVLSYDIEVLEPADFDITLDDYTGYASGCVSYPLVRNNHTATLAKNIRGFGLHNSGSRLNITKMKFYNIQISLNESTDYIPHQSNSQTLNHEPLRAVGDVKDKYVMIDGKWYIERKCAEYIITDVSGNEWNILEYSTGSFLNGNPRNYSHKPNSECICDKLKSLPISTNNIPDFNAITSALNGKEQWRIKIINCETKEDYIEWVSKNPLKVVVELATPTYEEIDYNPLEVYQDITHITTNSTIPTNITIKNHGYNMVALKENTQYTLYVNKNTTNALTYRLGDYVEINSLSKFTFTTPSTLTDKTLRIDGKGAKVKDLMLIEGTPTNDSIGYFDGLKSSYECEQVTDESDENYGKYKVTAKIVGKNKWRTDLIESLKIPEGKYYVNSNYTLKELCPNLIEGHKYRVSFSYDTTGLEQGSMVAIALIPSPNISREYFTYTKDLDDNLVYFYGGNLYNTFTNIQIEEGTQITEYEPYFESKQTIYLNSPLLKGDEIVWKDNKIQHYHKMGSMVLDGSDDENISIETTLTKDNTIGFKYYDDNIASVESYCDKFMYEFSFEDKEHHVNNPGWLCFLISKSKLQTQDSAGFKQWLQQNPIKVAYTLATPYYEEISDYPLKLNVIANSSLSTESTIQVTNISFNIYEETLPYLYPNTKYYITFNADVDRNNIIINLGGNHVVFDCKVGFNKVEITTPSDTTNLLTFSGTGVNIDHVMVTKQDIDEYFEGMKSVGECENNTLEIICKNNDNSKSITQTLTHEPLRAVGDIKDRYVLIDGKWYIERNCGSYTATGNEPIYEYLNSYSLPVSYFIIYNNTFRFINSNCISNKFKNIAQAWNNNGKGIGVLSVTASSNENRVYFSNHTASELKSILNGFTIIYQLATPTYEPIDYNPFEVYSEVTHISNNSLIPANMVIKNHGYNTILKPSTKYTVALNKANGTIGASLGGSSKVESSNNVFTITTPSTLTDNCLRLYGKGIKSKDVMILEGDKTNYIPGYFEGIESVFEQEYDEAVGKYKVKAKVVGKNLFDYKKMYDENNLIKKYSGYGFWTYKVKVRRGVKYTVSVGINELLNVNGYIPYLCITDKEDYNKSSRREWINHSSIGFKQNTSMISSDGYLYIQIPSSVNNSKALLDNIGYIQIEQGTQATPYEPYKENYIEFYINEPLRGIGDVKDKVYVKNDKVVVERNCGSVVLDGSEDGWYIWENNTNCISFAIIDNWNTPNHSYLEVCNYIYTDKFIRKTYTKNLEWFTSHCYPTVKWFAINLLKAKLQTQDINGFKQWLQQNPTTVVYQLASPTYEEVECDLSKLVLENYSNSSLILDTNIPPTVDVRYSGEVPVVSQAKTLSSNIESTTLDINENIIPYMCDIDYRIVELQLMNGDTQGEGIELLGIGDIEILGNENVLFNNREDKKYNYSYDMLKRDILSQRYSKEEYQYRLDRYLLANKISNEEYKELEGLLNNGE